MLWNRNKGGSGTATQEAKPEKVKKASPSDVAARQMEKLEPGQEILFRLGEIYIKPFVAVLRNADYPAKGKQFTVFQDSKGPDGKPAGKRGRFWDSNKAAEIADWIVSREGKRVEA